MPQRKSLKLICFGIVALALLLVLPFVGMLLIPLREVVNPELNPVDYRIFWGLRVPRLLTAYAAGGALARFRPCSAIRWPHPSIWALPAARL